MSMAMKYGLMKRQKMAEGGMACAGAECPGCEKCKGGMMMAEGGEVKEDDGSEGIVDRIMKRFAKGGAVEQDTPVMADFEDNDFDVLPGMEDTEADETGKNSGDEIGDEQEDDDRKDIVSRIMKSRSKKDRMPRPA